MEGIFVIGVDTGVGKTTTCAGLLKLLHHYQKVAYWKPVQTGTMMGDDTAMVKSLTGLSDEYFFEPSYRFPEPLSPHWAAKKWGKRIDLNQIMADLTEHQKQGKFLILEGAGGLLVPLNENELLIDLVKKVGFKVLLVSEDRVGAINHTLLTLNAAREANIDILGVILTKARRTFGNKDAISEFGKVKILAEIDPSEDLKLVISQVANQPALQRIFGGVGHA